MRPCRALLILALSVASGIISLGSYVAQAQDRRVMRLAFVSAFSPSSAFASRIEPAFWERLRELGWVDGQNLAVESRSADGQIDRFPALMTEVVKRKADIIVTYTTPAAIAAQNATSTIPIVDVVMGDPLATGIVASLARPGGNLIGLSMGQSEGIEGKWLELLQDTVPRLSTVAVIADAAHPMSRENLKRLQALAPTRGLKVRIYDVRRSETLERAFEQARQDAQAVLVLAVPNLIVHQRRVVMPAAKYKLPDLHIQRDFVDAGGLMAYGPDYIVMFRRGAEYVDKILRGTNAGDLPIEQPTKFELVVNLKTARVLGLKVPESILLRADEVIR